MQINDLRVQKFNKISNISNLSYPELLSTITIIDKIHYDKDVSCFKVTDRNGYNNQLYITTIQPQSMINQIVYLRSCPKLLFLKGDIQNLILEENILIRLDQKLIDHQSNSFPYLDQLQAKKIIEDLTATILNLQEHNIHYNCISPRNVVMDQNGKWQFSIVGLILGIDMNNPQYFSNKNLKDQYQITFALGCLLFKMVFGFSPIGSSGRLDNFQINNYFNYLYSENSQKLLKVYHFSQRCLEISPACLKLIQEALTGQLPLFSWQSDPYFQNPFTHVSKANNKNKEILMINSVEPNGYSLIMSAIDYKKNHPHEKFNQKYIPSPDQLSLSQALQNLQKDSLLSLISKSPQLSKRSEMLRNSSILPEWSLPVRYFQGEQFDPDQDYPCRDLIKWIQTEKRNTGSQSNEQYEAQLKLYGYPYAVAFELMKVQSEQPVQVRRKIQKVGEILLQLSSLYYPKQKVQPLHNSQPRFNSFEQIKPVFRENINDLYQHFLNEAMRRYNTKSDTISLIQKAKKKQKGLEYYRLCLKLLEASLLYRKGGHDLNLPRIQTSQRKQIDFDLSDLLGRYFPKKPEVY